MTVDKMTARILLDLYWAYSAHVEKAGLDPTKEHVEESLRGFMNWIELHLHEL